MAMATPLVTGVGGAQPRRGAVWLSSALPAPGVEAVEAGGSAMTRRDQVTGFWFEEEQGSSYGSPSPPLCIHATSLSGHKWISLDESKGILLCKLDMQDAGACTAQIGIAAQTLKDSEVYRSAKARRTVTCSTTTISTYRQRPRPRGLRIQRGSYSHTKLRTAMCPDGPCNEQNYNNVQKLFPYYRNNKKRSKPWRQALGLDPQNRTII